MADTDSAKAAGVLGLKSWSGLAFKRPPLIDLGSPTEPKRSLRN